ncbi:hypothetical protein [Streptacidiphilus anmyonensis]|uniref:hypothetical protein n=1 Tax=Streptacidiphilus anmyonensis TaxID=405782 RepID=UPI0005A63103|nr:hypothetical protein [Streptacidiphilus anmyonensis]
MRADLLAAELPDLDEALAAVDAFDEVLAGGLLRPQPAQAAGLNALADAVAGSPIAALVAEAAEKAAAGVAGEEHLVALAAGRTALFGAVHDAVLARVDEATGRPREAAPPFEPGAPLPVNLLASARAWLCDVARAGWRGMDHELAATAAPVVSALLPSAELRRLAVLLDGFAAELAASCPGRTLEQIPLRRWADLWARGMLLTQPGAIAAAGAAAESAAGAASTALTGRLLPLGVDLHEHATGVQAQVHAVFEPADGGPARLVRASVSAPKPDTVVGAGAWQLLRPHLSLLAAAGEGRAMELTGMPVTDEGDLLWSDDRAHVGESADVFTTARVALPAVRSGATAPLDRHPTRIAEPVLVEGYTVDGSGAEVAFVIGGERLAVDTGRVPAASPLTPQAVAGSRACVGLLRWDAGRFRLQPLAVQSAAKSKAAVAQAGAWAGGTSDKNAAKAEKAATDAVTVLRERAGRLLRS